VHAVRDLKSTLRACSNEYTARAAPRQRDFRSHARDDIHTVVGPAGRRGKTVPIARIVPAAEKSRVPGPLSALDRWRTIVPRRPSRQLARLRRDDSGWRPSESSSSGRPSRATSRGAPCRHAGDYTIAFEFRRCQQCAKLNVVKDGWFWCDACSAQLSREWNVQSPPWTKSGQTSGRHGTERRSWHEVSPMSRILRMPRGKPSPKLAITVDPDVHRMVLDAAAAQGMSVSAWMTAAARRALRREDGLAAVRLRQVTRRASSSRRRGSSPWVAPRGA
jgi:hypothetical protein